jgi:hypothetical protein
MQTPERDQPRSTLQGRALEPALGRPQRNSDIRRSLQYFGQTVELQEKQQNSPKKPPRDE